MILLLLFVSSIIISPSLTYKPVVLIHGIMTGSNSMEMIRHRIEEKHPGTTVYNVNRFESWSSLESMWHQVMEIGQDIANISSQHPEGINLIDKYIMRYFKARVNQYIFGKHAPSSTASSRTINRDCGQCKPINNKEKGYSQGGLIARGIVQTFPNVSVSTFISLSSPQAGQYGAGFLHLVFPGLVKDTVWQLFYSSVGQHTSVGNYWNDPYHQSLFETYSVFLPYINNEKESAKSKDFKNNLLRLKRLVLIGGPDDNVITPWQSSQFGYYDDDQEIVIEMKSQDIYVSDRIGLRALDESRRLHIVTVPGVNHFSWHVNVTIVDNYLLPYLD